MNLSVRWQAILVLSLLLLVPMTSFIAYYQSEQQTSRASQAENTKRYHEELLASLLEEFAVNLSDLAQLIADHQLNQGFDSELSLSLQLSRAIEDAWFRYEVSNELNYLGFWRDEQNISSSSSFSADQLDAISPAIDELLTLVRQANAPQELTLCNQQCSMFVAVPHIDESGNESTVVVGRHLSGLIERFYKASRSAIGIIITETNKFGSNFREIPAWRSEFYAISDFSNSSPIYQAFSELVGIDEINPINQYMTGRKTYYFYKLDIAPLSSYTSNYFFLTMEDLTEDYALIDQNIASMTYSSIVLYGACVILLYLFVGRFISNLQRVLDALHQLPQRKFLEASKILSTRTPFFKDEMHSLEKESQTIIQQLSELYDEVDSKSLMLQQQVVALKSSREFLGRLLENADVFIINQRPNGEIFENNRRADILGDLKGSQFVSLMVEPEQGAEFMLRVEQLKKRSVESFYQEVKIRGKNDKELIVRWTHTLIEGEDGRPVVLSIGMDHTEQKSAEDNLRWLANHDSLTGLGNRRSFNEKIFELIEEGNQFLLVFIDVNKFKVINDIYGHSAGDSVLIDIANQVRLSLRSSDVAFRLAGDEFIMLVRGDGDSHGSILSKITQNLERSIQTHDKKNIFYSVSVGAASYPDHGNNVEELMVNADLAMYHAKKKGHGNWHIFDNNDDHASKAREETEILVELRVAIANRSFQLVYQPILDIKKNLATHFEALLRMTDSKGKAVSPGRFIPLAEKYGEIRAIDEWVLDAALSDLKRYSATQKELVFSINVSAPTLQSNDFPAMVFHKIFSHRVSPSSIIIELTETAYIENFDQVLTNLNELVTHGVQVALDDFGVGFSSFNYLKQLPLTYVKLDGSYVRHLTENEDDQVFVKNLSAMIGAFSMKTIAEFVENEGTLVMLEELGVDYAQGYHIAKPEPISDVLNRFNRASCTPTRHYT